MQAGNAYRTLGVVGMPTREETLPMRPELRDAYRLTVDPHGRLMRSGHLLTTVNQDGG